MKREIKFEFIIENEDAKHISAPYTIEGLIETCEEDILIAMEDTCMNCSCYTESQNFCDCGGTEFENAKIIGKRQFTGLKDKNGVDIYEGDIVELEVEFQGVSNNHYEQEGFHVLHTGEVSFIPSRGFHLKIHKSWDLDNDEPWINPKIKDIVQYRSKVIGNIHQNPELL